MEKIIVKTKNYTKELEGINLLLLRHGKTLHNRPDNVATFAGARVDSKLNEEGRTNTVKLAKEIARNIDINLIVSSHMKRSIETAWIISSQILEQHKTNPDIIEIDDLQEIDVGDFTGLTEREARILNPKAANAFYDGRINDLDFPGGENYNAIKLRVTRCITNIKVLARNYHSILAVGHGMFNRVMLHEIVPDHSELWQPRSYPHDRLVIIQP